TSSASSWPTAPPCGRWASGVEASPCPTPPTASCGSSSRRRAPDRQQRRRRMLAWLVLLQTTLTISVGGPLTNPEYLPLRVAEAEGYFAQENLRVTLQTTRAEATAAEALARGQAPLAATSLDAALELGHVAGAPPRLVFGLTTAPPVALLVPAARASTIRSIADLAGKTVGIAAPGTPAELALMSLLSHARLRTDQ